MYKIPIGAILVGLVAVGLTIAAVILNMHRKENFLLIAGPCASDQECFSKLNWKDTNGFCKCKNGLCYADGNVFRKEGRMRHYQ